ncbi:MAG: DMT family transporter [Oscillospiraceae bacterium]|nr:DMT family transporter [Oscillospiraceae bacterium]
MSKQWKADLALILVTLFWGVSYYLVDLSLTELPEMTLNASRFVLAFVILAVIFRKRVFAASRATLKYSLYVGILLVFVYAGSTYGIARTSLSNAGFICALPVVVTPVLDFLINRRRPEKRLGIALIMCTIGLAMLTLNENFGINIGDALCLLCAVSYGADMIVTERAVQQEDVDPLALGVIELGIAGAVMTVIAFLTEQPVLPQSSAVWGSVLFLSICCTGVAFVVQSVAQQYTSATHVGLIFTLEPVFSGIVAYFVADERLLPRGYAGAALMLLSLLVMEMDWKKLKRK